MTGWCVWRHPKPQQVAGRCLGRCDVPVDPRRAKRLAHRVRARARREGGARVVWTSPLERGHAVGRWLRRFGFAHRVDPLLLELDFGAWDGLPWSEISAAEVDAWSADFWRHAPGGGESLAQLMQRVQQFVLAHPQGAWVVGHAGWINAWQWWQRHGERQPQAHEWPSSLGYSRMLRVEAPPSCL